MVIQLEFQYLSIRELKLELITIETRVVFVDNTMIVRANNDNVCGIIIL